MCEIRKAIESLYDEVNKEIKELEEKLEFLQSYKNRVQNALKSVPTDMYDVLYKSQESGVTHHYRVFADNERSAREEVMRVLEKTTGNYAVYDAVSLSIKLGDLIFTDVMVRKVQ